MNFIPNLHDKRHDPQENIFPKFPSANFSEYTISKIPNNVSSQKNTSSPEAFYPAGREKPCLPAIPGTSCTCHGSAGVPGGRACASQSNVCIFICDIRRWGRGGHEAMWRPFPWRPARHGGGCPAVDLQQALHQY